MDNLKPLANTLYENAFNYGISKPEIPLYIVNNLKYNFYDWQKKALENLLIYHAIREKENTKSPIHLMFNMATGSGKTLLMAATILYYYQQGYRHFLFFVNRNNIVDKTENNFLDNTHTKYLFKNTIVINDVTIDIKKVDVFSDYPQGIEIKFTTIQKLYNDIHIVRENQTTLDDLHNKDIVMLADEAHHLDSGTKRNKPEQAEMIPIEITSKTSDEEVERRGWEHTVIELILNKNNSGLVNKNILLEFTATIPSEEAVTQKYIDKKIYAFGLKEFLQAGYTKEINLISSTLEKKERILQALVFQWYRHKIAIKYDIANFKPVILFRSKTIEESKEDYERFLQWIDDLVIKDLDFLKNIKDKIFEATQSTLFELGKYRTEILLTYIKKEGIHLGEIVHWIKESYQERNTIITNSKSNKTKTEKTDGETEALLNSLEDKDNHIRAIFTVDRLTEGWDVLNLYDIVRLYQGQNAGGSTKKTPEATIKEKQLIGRGVRYYPFHFKDKVKNKRKFDEDLNHDLRILEELYYYTFDEESRYISHLKEELKRDGYIRDDKKVKRFALKKGFQNSGFYKDVKVWYNTQLDNPNRKKKDLEYIKNYFPMQYKIASFKFSEEKFDFENQTNYPNQELGGEKYHTITKKFKDIERHIVQKAINIKAKQEQSLFQFESLKEELEIKSMEDLQNAKLADFEINIIVEKSISYDEIDNKEKLKMVLKFLDNISTQLKEHIVPKIGSDFVAEKFSAFFSEPKIKTINDDENSQYLNEYLEDKEWYVLDAFHGTSEEIELIKFVKSIVGNLEEQYEKFYLLRNEEVYKIYDFEQGRGFQPDFILFLKSKSDNKNKEVLYYQIFIEPKGEQFIGSEGLFEAGKEGWKEEFLDEISRRYGFENVIRADHPNYRLIGLPFFNKDHNSNFMKQFGKICNT